MFEHVSLSLSMRGAKVSHFPSQSHWSSSALKQPASQASTLLNDARLHPTYHPPQFPSLLHAFPAVFFLFASLPCEILSKIFSRSLSSLSFVTSHLLGAMPMGTLWPLLFSRETRSTCTTYLRR